MSVTDFGDPHRVIHIPARDLAGAREATLADLDLFLAQLQVVRMTLCGQALRLEGLNAAASHRRPPATPALVMAGNASARCLR